MFFGENNMNSVLSIWSIYEQVKNDFVKDAKKYFIIFSIQGGILFFLHLFIFFLVSKDIVTVAKQQQYSLITNVFAQPFSFSAFLILLLTVFSKIIPFVFYVGLLNFIYILKTKSLSLSVQDFFREITIRKLARVFLVFVLLIFLFTFLSFVVFIPFIFFFIFNIATTAIITFFASFCLLFSIFPVMTLFVRVKIALFIIFEPDVTLFGSIQKSFARTKGYGVRIALIWIVELLIILITTIILALPFLFFFGDSLKSVFSSDQASSFVLTYLEQGHIALAPLFYIIFFYVFSTVCMIIFVLTNGEIYKRFSKTQESKSEPSFDHEVIA
jgi:hypothetical protein